MALQNFGRQHFMLKFCRQLKLLKIGSNVPVDTAAANPNVPNLSGMFGALTIDQKRTYAFPSKLPFQWVAEEKPPALSAKGSGDNEGLPNLDLKNPKMYFESSKELQTANEDVKKIFSLEFATMKERKMKAQDVILKKVQRHRYDMTSEEARVAVMTCAIRNMQRHLQLFPKRPRVKVILSMAIQKRRKTLKKLRMKDYDRFAWLLNELKLTFTPPVQREIPITRRGELQRMADEYCDVIKHERIEKYAALLKNQQKEFLEEKQKALQWIKEEEKELGVTSENQN